MQRIETLNGIQGISDEDPTDEQQPQNESIDPQSQHEEEKKQDGQKHSVFGIGIASSLVSNIIKHSKELHTTPETKMREFLYSQMPGFLLERMADLVDFRSEQRKVRVNEEVSQWTQAVDTYVKQQTPLPIDQSFVQLVKILIFSNLPATRKQLEMLLWFIGTKLLRTHDEFDTYYQAFEHIIMDTLTNFIPVTESNLMLQDLCGALKQSQPSFRFYMCHFAFAAYMPCS